MEMEKQMKNQSHLPSRVALGLENLLKIKSASPFTFCTEIIATQTQKVKGKLTSWLD